VEWPSYPLSQVIAATKKAAEKDPFVQRVCISAITSSKAPKDLVTMAKKVKEGTGLKVSTLITPTLFTREDFDAMKAAGVENITVAVDAATPQIFDKLRGKQARGPHKWERYLSGIKEAVEVLGSSPLFFLS
jgi:biotin synthase